MIINKKVIISSVLGNILEFYDLMLFGIFAPIISPLFFYSNHKSLSLLMGYLAFAISFIFRPLGALYFGQIADKFGRKKSLTSSILLMACATGMIGLIPTYAQIGIIAPLLVTFFRCVQGFSAGGEYNSSAIYLLEYMNKSRNISVSFLTASGVVGTLLATLFFSISLNPSIPDWFWRVPFLSGSILGIVGLYIRSKLPESPEFNNILKQNKILKNPLKEVLKSDKEKLLISFFIGSFNGIIYYFQFVYLTTYFNNYLGIELKYATNFNTIGLLFYMVFLVLNGFLADLIGTKKIMSFACWGFIFLTIPIFYVFSFEKITYIIICEIVLSYMNASFCGLKHVFLADLFSANKRCIGVSLGYSLGLAIFGGSTPFIMTLLDKKIGGWFSSYYIMSFAVFSILAITRSKASENITKNIAVV